MHEENNQGMKCSPKVSLLELYSEMGKQLEDTSLALAGIEELVGIDRKDESCDSSPKPENLLNRFEGMLQELRSLSRRIESCKKTLVEVTGGMPLL